MAKKLRKKRPIILGIVGDSAAGKTTLSSGLVKLIGADRVAHVCTDDYHKYDRTERKQLSITPLHPDCNYMDIMEQHMERLHYGLPILKPIYDHANGTLVRPEYLEPLEFIIVEGLLGYHSAALRQFYDIKVYLDPNEDMRKLWKVKRDTSKRGYTKEQVLADIDKREPDSAQFIRPQRKDADIIIHFYPPDGVSAEEAGSNLNVRLTLRPTIQHPNLSYLWDNPYEEAGIRMLLDRDSGKPVDILEIDGSVSPAHAAELEQAIWNHMPDLKPLGSDQFGDYYDRTEVRHSDPLALTQLLLAFHLLRQYNDVDDLPFAKPVSIIGQTTDSSS
jgi:phosphoribulokinase